MIEVVIAFAVGGVLGGIIATVLMERAISKMKRRLRYQDRLHKAISQGEALR